MQQQFGVWTSTLINQPAVKCKFKTNKPSPVINLAHRASFSEALDFFNLYFTGEILQSIVTATNENGRSKESKQEWKDTDVSEVRALLGCLMYMGLVHLPDVDHYWAEVTEQVFITSRFPRNRFKQLYHALSTSAEPTDAERQADSLMEIRSFAAAMNKQFSALLVPGSNLCVDETMIKFRGKHDAVQLMPKKPIRIGFKCWSLATTDGYMLKLDLYGGKKSEDSEVSMRGLEFDLLLPGLLALLRLVSDMWCVMHCVLCIVYDMV